MNLKMATYPYGGRRAERQGTKWPNMDKGQREVMSFYPSLMEASSLLE